MGHQIENKLLISRLGVQVPPGRPTYRCFMGNGYGDLGSLSSRFLKKLEAGNPVKVRLKNGSTIAWLFREFDRRLPSEELENTVVVMLHPRMKNGKLHYTGDVYSVVGDLLLRGVYVDRFTDTSETKSILKDYL